MAAATALAISVCDWRGLKVPTAGASGPPAPNRRSTSASYLPAGARIAGAAGALVSTASGEADNWSVKIRGFVEPGNESGRDIGYQLHLQQRNMIFELQFTLLEAA